MDADSDRDAPVIAATRRWLEAAVIGLDLCPFAGSVAATGRIRYRVSAARSAGSLRDDLVEELRVLEAADPAQMETTLLIHPWALQDFFAFNDFLAEADAIVEELGRTGAVQIASFHPRYQFTGTDVDDVENCTNRSPFPMLHLLREESVERALAAVGDPSSIYRRNIATMRRIGPAGWERLRAGFISDHETGSESSAD
jgi:uncharacterized protein